jgi:hypothetical protein
MKQMSRKKNQEKYSGWIIACFLVGAFLAGALFTHFFFKCTPDYTICPPVNQVNQLVDSNGNLLCVESDSKNCVSFDAYHEIFRQRGDAELREWKCDDEKVALQNLLKKQVACEIACNTSNAVILIGRDVR